MVGVMFLGCRGGNGDAADSVADSLVADSVVFEPQPRTSITFILGDDNTAFNQYYSLAGHYYRISSDDRTDFVVDGLTSLKQVLDYLNSHPAPDSLPYGLVNLVTHGNEFVDLQMKVTPYGQRSSAASIRKAIAKKRLSPPDSCIVDSCTLVYLHGCAVGNNKALLDALAEAFGGRATVMASRLFEYYAYLSPNKDPQSIRHYYARTWYAFYHPDSTYNEDAILRQLQRRYPHDKVNWQEGLRRRFQNDPSQLYHYSFNVPCSYEETYPNRADMPSVASAQKRSQWVDSHPDFLQMLATTHVPREFFQIKFYRQTHVLENDSILYGLRVKARAGVICLIQPLIEADSSNRFAPFKPDFRDSAFFEWSM